MWKCGQLQLSVMLRVIVTEYQIITALVLIGIRVALDGGFYVNELAEVQSRAIKQQDCALDEAYVAGAFIIGNARGMNSTARLNGVMDGLKVDIN